MAPSEPLSGSLYTPAVHSYRQSLKLREGMGLTLRDDQRDRVVHGCLVTMIFAAVFLQRFALYAGTTGVPLNLFVTLGAVGVLALMQRTNIDPFRAALVFLFVAYVAMCAIFNSNMETWTSAVFALAIYIPFALVLRSGDAAFMDCVHAFRTMVLICAIAGILQFPLQFVTSTRLLFTFKGFVPAGMLLENFNTFQPLTYGSPLYKSNGFFMIEPSTFSQFVAVALIIELLYYQAKWALAIYGAALLLSYSGTGFIALLLVPAILVSRRSYGTIMVFALLAMLALAASQALHLNVIGQRAATEFSSSDSSFYSRFIAPLDLIGKYLLPIPQNLLFGVGPGTMLRYGLLMPYETADPAWGKVLFEYGLVGSLLFWPMLAAAVFGNAPSVWLSGTLMIGFLTFGGEFLDPRLQTLLLVFCALPKRMPPIIKEPPTMHPDRALMRTLSPVGRRSLRALGALNASHR